MQEIIKIVRAIIASEVPNEFTSITININPASETTRTNPTSITFFLSQLTLSISLHVKTASTARDEKSFTQYRNDEAEIPDSPTVAKTLVITTLSAPPDINPAIATNIDTLAPAKIVFLSFLIASTGSVAKFSDKSILV